MQKDFRAINFRINNKKGNHKSNISIKGTQKYFRFIIIAGSEVGGGVEKRDSQAQQCHENQIILAPTESRRAFFSSISHNIRRQ